MAEGQQVSASYSPGHCNIGPSEIRRRLRNGYFGLAGMIFFIIIIEAFHLPRIWKIGLFAPAVYSISGFLQGWQRFCFWFGLTGLFSMTGKRQRLSDDISLHKDRLKAWLLIAEVFSLSLLVTLAYYFI